jgi:heptosyltransferase-3
MFTVQRSGALGDVIMLTPVLKKLHQKHGKLRLLTHRPEGVHGLPFITEIALPGLAVPNINFDLVYEREPNLHPVLAYAEAAGIELELWERQPHVAFAQDSPINFVKPNTVILHPAISWASRTFSPDFWGEVIAALHDEGYRTITLGGAHTAIAGLASSYDLVECTTLPEAAKLISRAALFIGPDSGLMHVAGATSTPIVGLFTSVDPLVRLPWRNSKLGAGCVAVTANIECVGCLARRPAPWTTEPCFRTGPDIFSCVGTITTEMVMDAVHALMKKPLTPVTPMRKEEALVRV